MCGIAGYAKINSDGKIKFDYIKQMIDEIKHRGPDQSGILKWENIVLGFNRLSIRDLSKWGDQPYVNSERNVALVFNGEIYNADELKNELIMKGYQFRGNSDTEVLMNLYLEYGIDIMLKRINGIFSIVIYDARNFKTYLIRDRFGIKPLYYTVQDGVIVFASEQKSILKYKEFKAELNKDALIEQFVFRSPYEASLLKRIESVLPGKYLVVSDEKIVEITYFDINSYQRYSTNDISFDEAKELLKDILQKVISEQKMSDVPIGMQLSGGIDSSLIAYFGNHEGRPLAGHSVYVKGDYYNEQDHIEHVKNILKMNTYHYALNENTVAEIFDKTIYYLDTINTHFNAIGFYHLSQNASSKCKVLLGGEGADELFGGYLQFAEAKRLSRSKKESFEYAKYAIQKDMHVSQDVCRNILNINVFLDIQKREELFVGFSGTNFDKFSKYLIQTHLTDLLIKQDKMAMANSIENRVPFLDNRIVECCMTLPEEYLLYEDEQRGYVGKYILKSIASDIFGTEFAFSKKKGFPIPIRNYMKSEIFRNRIAKRLLSKMYSRSIYNIKYLLSLFDNISIISDEEVNALWKAFNLEIWCEFMGI